jgi:hypothetical protein
MAYRQAAPREAIEATPDVARFSVRHRSLPTLLAAAVLLVAAAGDIALVALSGGLRGPLCTVALLVPAILVGTAFVLSVNGAAEIDLEVAQFPDERRVRVTLRRRWGLLPWCPPLRFVADRAPSLVTTWQEGVTSGKQGPSRPYKQASLVLRAGDHDIVLPNMRGPRRRERDILVRDHAACVLEAKARYDEAIALLRRDRSAPSAHSGPTLVGSSEHAFSFGVALAVVGGLLLAGAFATVAVLLPTSIATPILGGLVLPIVGAVSGTAAWGCAYGRTLYLRERGEHHSRVTYVPDLFLFGPMTWMARRETLASGFRFSIEHRTVGDDDVEMHVVVLADCKKELRRERDEKVVRRFAIRLGGREIKNVSAST